MRRIKNFAENMRYIHELKYWPHFSYDIHLHTATLGLLRHKQGKLLGQMAALGFKLKDDALLESHTLEALKTSEIEGVIVNPEQVRSSVAKRLGIEYIGLLPADRNVDGLVETLIDATKNHKMLLTKERLLGWHLALFPAAQSGNYEIEVGKWRTDSTGPMQVISGAIGKEKVHYEAPPAHKLDDEMDTFLAWFNATDNLDSVLKAAIAHLWFVTIHPFDDGNGRIARAIADMQLAKADNSDLRFYSMSAQIRTERKLYYENLEKTQKGNLDINDWLAWFFSCLSSALDESQVTLKKIVDKSQFWQTHQDTTLNERQKSMVNKLMGNFEGKLNTSKYAKMSKCSADTALRDIQDMITKGILIKEEAGGRSTNYSLNW